MERGAIFVEVRILGLGISAAPWHGLHFKDLEQLWSEHRTCARRRPKRRPGGFDRDSQPFSIYPDSASSPESMDPHVPRSHLFLEPASDEHVGSSEAGQEATLSSQYSNNIPRYVIQTRERIEACNEEHGSGCVLEPMLQRPPADVPRWLIDTQQQCIVPGVSANQYLALSYVWPETRGSVDSNGLPPRTLLLDNESIADFQQPGFLAKEDIVDRIPAVIHHAMGLTLALGERYLWVDRLCIVQNDVGDGGTLSQVAKMDKIYAGAYLTIIAAATDKMYEREITAEWPTFESKRRMRSIFTERGIADYASGKSTTSLLHVEDMSALSEKEIVNIMSARYGSLSRSRWATRGWTYQEQILCKRAVVLVDWGFFWDCQCSIWDGVDLVPGQDFDGVRLRADMGQRFATRWWPDFGFYLDLICPYNGREFSYPQDTLLGISGVLNALGNSFPGGFIHGLPRLFLDHTLLWQPFGTAERRLGRREDEELRTSLPSWSWAGWQCYVDPWSLRSGLSYSNDKESRWRCRSWRTRNLVQWNIAIGAERSEPILEPLELDKLVGLGYTHQDDINLTDWVVVERDSRQSQSNDTYWYNKRESWTYFRHPIPIPGSCVNQNLLAAQAYLTCSTTTATYLPATVLHKKGQNSWCSFGPPKISVFEDRIFSSGPRNDKVCSVLVLQRPNGGFGGLLRMMVNDIIDEYASIELIAISKGSATARDMRQSFEWRIYETAQDAYNQENIGKTFKYEPKWMNDQSKRALLFTTAMAFNDDTDSSGSHDAALEQSLTGVQERADEILAKMTAESWESGASEWDLLHSWYRARLEFFGAIPKVAGDLVDGFDKVPASAKARPSEVDEKMLCEFYNVVWIERRDGMAYRRACGWVPKHIWEANATGPVEVKLG